MRKYENVCDCVHGWTCISCALVMAQVPCKTCGDLTPGSPGIDFGILCDACVDTVTPRAPTAEERGWSPVEK